MTLKQIIGYGLMLLVASAIWNIWRGTDAAQAAGIIGGNFGMLTGLCFAAWINRK